MPKKMLSFRIEKSKLEMLDLVLREKNIENRSKFIEELIEKYTDKEIKFSEQYKALQKNKRTDQRLKKINSEYKEIVKNLNKYKSRKKIQRFIDTSDYSVAQKLYQKYKPSYPDLEYPIKI